MRRALLAATLSLCAAPVFAGDGTHVPYPIVGTGQSQCCDDMGRPGCPAPGQAFSGQDAQHPGRHAAYRDNGDGTVTDLVTGLMWEKNFHRVFWQQAKADAAAARTGGYADWRVPTIKELYSLMNFNGSTGSARPETTGAPADAKPYLDTSVFGFKYPAQGRFIDAQYVTSTTYTGITMGHDHSFFGVNFADGRIKAYPQDGGPRRRDYYARYVRGSTHYGVNDFTDNRDGTVTDRATGLTWMQADSGAYRRDLGWTRKQDGRLDWGESLRFCQTLTLAGHADWRLPNAKELNSIVDYRRSPQATDSAAIDPIFAITEIKDEGGRRNWPFFWSSTSHLDGRRPGDFAVYFAFGEALGYPHQGGPMMGGRGQNGGSGMGRGFPPPPGMQPRQGPDQGTGLDREMAGFGPPPGDRPDDRRPRFDGQGGNDTLVLTDVHGAGAQRSSPKSGDESRLPKGAGPQGDVLRIYNYARCVRGE